jgi:3-methyladenine DNA glycosylase AlkD
VRELTAQDRPVGEFDPSRYFRTTEPLQFLNVRTAVVRSLGRAIAREHRDSWTIDDAVAFAGRMLREPQLELKGVGIEVLGARRREFVPRLLPVFRGWLKGNLAANWATTDTICGTLISPLLLLHPALVQRVKGWTRHRNLWVRRAAAVSLVRLAARGLALDDAYDVATALRADSEDLIHKAAGWLLREAGRTDAERLARYLRQHGPSIPRTTLRYAIERFPAGQRAALLRDTRASA